MKEYTKNVNSARVTYFTGTGNTGLIADHFERVLTRRGLDIVRHPIKYGDTVTSVNEDLLIVLFPVYAFEAPLPVLQWINNLKNVTGTPAVVISNSGGGEVTPNTACRVSCIKALKRKGFDVTYERMLVMPSNWVTATPEPLAVKLLEVLPLNVEKIVMEVIKGVGRRTTPNFIDRIMPLCGKVEVQQGKTFGKKMKVNENCVGCGLCSRECPSNNIEMVDHKPAFGDRCVICTRCIYLCPQRALAPGVMKSILLKEGYNLNELQRKVPYTGEFDLQQLTKHIWWSGVRKYLIESGIGQNG